VTSFVLNGKSVKVDDDPSTPLLWVLRDSLGLTGTKFGCGMALCGACTVHLNGQAIRSCVTPVSAVGDGKVVTLAGLGTPEKPHPIQKAFIDEQAAQCGYCINGMIMKAKELLDQKPHPSDAEVRDALAGHFCRCGTHNRIVAAVVRVGKESGRVGQ